MEAMLINTLLGEKMDSCLFQRYVRVRERNEPKKKKENETENVK